MSSVIMIHPVGENSFRCELLHPNSEHQHPAAGFTKNTGLFNYTYHCSASKTACIKYNYSLGNGIYCKQFFLNAGGQKSL